MREEGGRIRNRKQPKWYRMHAQSTATSPPLSELLTFDNHTNMESVA